MELRHWWWKFLAIALLLFASITALRTPLTPALVHVSPDRIAPGTSVIEVLGYNTDFQAGSTVVYLENADQRVCPSSTEVTDATHVQATFDVPTGLKEHLTTVGVDRLRYEGALFTEGLGQGIEGGACGPSDASSTVADAPFAFPNRSILYESIRNLHFHVPMWFTMIVLMAISMVQSIRVLGSNALEQDRTAELAAQVGLVFCGLGLVTGAFWARATWGAFWTNDVKLNGAAVTGLIYLAYFVLRGTVQDAHKRARLAAIYNIFAFVLLVMFLFVVPRLNAVDSLHPGNGGNSGFSDLDLDNRLRMIFYPAVLGWVLLGVWMLNLRVRAARIAEPLDP
ncbi:MAG TPA: cytochrome c biogenesis protein [Flavobacteriales bacterium]|nr:cytochrome c biogenesis protein CcsA [Flavobacteriales bacterium]MBK8532972.1 cytochrome c biogenesis protein CcsA [Flavobacteriales bacterium]MBP9178451.1 cytochrome c biogenesis protein CcsA [Flavobacteriales bacterium]MCC6911824.1 cytochrome c biogenesis protein CcsA [Flavobacteriales bacterium]HQW06499.1 cytochrome c biogenesis protein [Flavobacteriales bacterium]